MINILIVGAGGREHALAWKCLQNTSVSKICVTPGNGGIETIAACWKLTNHQQIIEKALKEEISLVIVGQEDYLVHGLTQELETVGIPVFGPSKSAAKLEGSKTFAKAFMRRHKIPTTSSETFTAFNKAKDSIKKRQTPFVVKADGLAAGKGVFICQSREEGDFALQQIMEDKVFGDAGSKVVIEEFLEGEEASYFVFSDGKNFVSMPSLQDHKRQKERDKGPNTGGMGCYSPAPILNQAVEDKVIAEIVSPTIKGMSAEGTPYKGVLYIGLMIHKGQSKVVEYNVRFGDPECQLLMMLLNTSLIDIAQACVQQKLKEQNISWKKLSGALVILASGGYPLSYKKGYLIQGLENIDSTNDLMVFHSGTKRDGNQFVTNGGRVLGVAALEKNLYEALQKTYRYVKQISWTEMQYRRDIGTKGLTNTPTTKPNSAQVAIILGSISDKAIAMKVTKIFDQHKVRYKIVVSSAHRTPVRTRNLMEEFKQEGVEIFIAIAGMAAHLPGVIAAETTCPVIGVPVNASMNGADALYSIVQMPPGIPVATVGIDRGENAAILATEILAIKYPEYKVSLLEMRLEMEEKVIVSQEEL